MNVRCVVCDCVVQVNGADYTFQSGDGNPNSYIVLFPNFREKDPSTYKFNAGANAFPFWNNWFGALKPNPSGRVMPEKYFMFMETHWGGGGLYTQTDGRASSKGILGAAVGFR